MKLIKSVVLHQVANDWLSSLVNSSDDAIIGKDIFGNIVSWNHSAEILFGFSKEEVIGKQINILSPQDKLNEMTDLIEKVKNGERVFHFETKRVMKNGMKIRDSILSFANNHK